VELIIIKELKIFIERKLKKNFNRILNLGIDDSLADTEQRKIRLVNGISFISGSFLILIGIVLGIHFYPYDSTDLSLLDNLIFSNNFNDIFDEVKIIFPIIDFIMGVFILSLLYLTYKKKYTTVSFILCFIAIIFSFMYYFIGNLLSIFFVLIPAILPLVLFKKKKYYLTLWILNYILFFLFTLYINFDKFDITKLNLGLPSFLNMTFMYILLFLIIYYFKNENIKNEKKLKKQNIKLHLQKEEINNQRQELIKINKLLGKKNTILKKTSITNELTGLYNRSKIEKEIKIEINMAENYGQIFSLIMIDIDYFKSINDEFGHQAGDKVLKEISSYLKDNTRTTDIVGRWGGEEFLIICSGTSLKGATKIAKKIRQGLENKSFSVDRTVTISLGVVEYKENENLKKMVQRVDKKLYEAKHKGRNQVVS